MYKNERIICLPLKTTLVPLNFSNLWILLFIPRSSQDFINSQCFCKLVLLKHVRQNLQYFVF